MPTPLDDRIAAAALSLMQNKINPYANINARNWLAKSIPSECKARLTNGLLLLGDGPFDAQELAQFLQSNNISAHLRDRFFLKAGEPRAVAPSQILTSPGDTPRFRVTPLVSCTPLNEAPWKILSSAEPVLIVLGNNTSQVQRALQSLTREDCCDDAPHTTATTLHPHWLERVELARDVVFRRSRSPHDVRFISQEMLLGLLFSGKSTTTGLDGPWQIYWDRHPGFQEITRLHSLNAVDDHFPWPVIRVRHGMPEFVTGEEGDFGPQIGLLSWSGYRVGRNGPGQETRRATLSKILQEETLPNINTSMHMAEWGTLNSAKRLRKMAQSIAMFCQNALNNNAQDNTMATQEWKSDLIWLKVSYYDGRFDFPWPDVLA